ncbi:type II toxin-antitoxin system Phd/YefM family antitoxin [Sandaracinobacteroides saxicola]|uniref:Antitoxin n=1 Tax=Sandaracinobacteroides saxicola TaxID=2759707 RepID=A0A7G5IGU6_9SPHN|nr:type II toxin-antitoxin system prevent-host-death family antitoxin [Sandaracinobacteroides saxicola]QMW22588.1 type II toxin-antitoxin system prevent-host-death family antitoxin [Sandaracinobacteroides saxicola]
MQIAVSEAKGKLTSLVRRAEAGEDVLLTRNGKPAVRLVPVTPKVDMARRMAAIDRAIEAARTHPALPGPCAARSQDFLYDENGL